MIGKPNWTKVTKKLGCPFRRISSIAWAHQRCKNLVQLATWAIVPVEKHILFWPICWATHRGEKPIQHMVTTFLSACLNTQTLSYLATLQFPFQQYMSSYQMPPYPFSNKSYQWPPTTLPVPRTIHSPKNRKEAESRKKPKPDYLLYESCSALKKHGCCTRVRKWRNVRSLHLRLLTCTRILLTLGSRFSTLPAKQSQLPVPGTDSWNRFLEPFGKHADREQRFHCSTSAHS